MIAAFPEKDRQFSELYYCRFERRILVGVEVDEAKVDPSFRNGILTVTLPKTEKAQMQVMRIAVKR
ncbi:Hsp20/alpha crystallin family protein (plasmid) [Rhizobium sp. L51/94]|nr:Hsp20/alpha crystallin family protein [Rhizobium sp. L51/94]